MQGFSFKDILTNKNKKPVREASFYQFYSNGCPQHYGVRTKDYKLLKYLDKNGEVAGIDLYDLRKDPWEMRNMAKDKNYKEKLSELETLLQKEIATVDIKPGQMPGRTDWKNEVDYGERSRANKKKKNKNN